MARPGFLRSGRGVLLAVGIIFLLVSPALAATDPPRLTMPVHATKADLNPARMYPAPYMAADKSNPKVAMGATVDLSTRRCTAVFTTDGGQTWSLSQGSPAPNDYPHCVWSNFANQAAMGRNGRGYVSITGWDDRDGGARFGNQSLIVSSTDDLGKNWRPTIVTPARGKEGEAVEQHRPIGLAVDAKNGGEDIVYATWNKTMPNRLAPNQEPSRPMVAVSTNAGRTFGEPVDLSKGVWTDAFRQQAFSSGTTTTVAPTASTTTTTTPPAGSRLSQPNQEANFGGSNPRLTLDDKGNVYVAWRSAQSNVPNTQPVAPTTFVSVSRDRGQTWTTNSVTSYTAVGNPASIAWTKAGGANGTLVMLYGRGSTPASGQGNDVMMQRSTDQGKTWTEAKNITDDEPSQMVIQLDSALAAAPNGRLDAVWYDTRSDPGIRGNDVYYTYSTDGGESWAPNLRVTDRTINRTYGVWGQNYDLSPPVGVASTNELTIIGWDDSRNTEPGLRVGFEPGFGVQDVYTSTVQHAVVGAGGASKATKIVIAGLLGLAAVAVVLLAAAMVMRRGQPAPGKKVRAKKEKAPAQIG